MKRPRLYPLFDTCPGALSFFFFFSGRATCMYHQSQATKVHVVYCFFIARPVLLQVGMGHTNQTSHLFLKPELRYRNAIYTSSTGKPTEG